jgi:phosphoglycolate phosphatase-like HAD superfamily hydrolase
MKQKAIIFDLDGTLCNTDHRQHFVQGEYKKKDFDKFYENMHLDPPHAWCVNLVHLYYNAGYKIFFCSGRPDNYREKTEVWIHQHTLLRLSEYVLMMRPAGNYGDDRIIKEAMYRTGIEPEYMVEVVIDDRQKVVDMWRAIGLTCLQCAPGDF